MGTTLFGKQINQTYDGLIKTTDNDPITSEKKLTDGLGNEIPMFVSQSGVKFTGVVNLAGVTSYVGAPWATSAQLATLQGEVDTNTADILTISGDVITNATNIGNEETARINADSVLQGYIDDLEAGVGNVISVNSLDGGITLSGGTNVSITDNGTDTITISASGGGGGGAVDDVNGLTGSITLSSTDLDYLTITEVGNDIQFEVLEQRTITEDVKNTTTGTLSKGTPVHITGSTGNEAEVIPANASTGLAAHLVLDQDLNAGQTGKAVAVGFINNVFVANMTNFQPGQEVYLAPSGGFTHIRPTGTNIVQYLGVVVKASGTSGPGTISGIIQNLGVENELPNLQQNYIWLGDSNGVPQAVDFAPYTGGTGSGVSSLNTLTGGLTLSGGTDITITDNGTDTITITSTASGGGISWNGSTANGIATYGSSTTADVESNLTFDGSTNLLTLSGDFSYNGGLLPQVPTGTDYTGEISPRLGSSLTIGKVYYMNSSGTWVVADNTAEATTLPMLGVAISTTEVLIYGYIANAAYAGYTTGTPIYLDAGGGITNVRPTTSTHFIRKLGFCYDGSTRVIHFNPSNEYYEIA